LAQDVKPVVLSRALELHLDKLVKAVSSGQLEVRHQARRADPSTGRLRQKLCFCKDKQEVSAVDAVYPALTKDEKTIVSDAVEGGSEASEEAIYFRSRLLSRLGY